MWTTTHMKENNKEASRKTGYDIAKYINPKHFIIGKEEDK